MKTEYTECGGFLQRDSVEHKEYYEEGRSYIAVDSDDNVYEWLLSYLWNDEPPRSLGKKLNEYIKENLTLTELNLLSRGQVPQDAACVLIGVPEYDFSADEITMLKDYMESGGGKLFWYTSPSILSTGVLGNMELFVSNIVAICGAETGEK